MHPYIFLLATGATLLISIIHLLLPSIFSPLRKIPGPLIARFTRLHYLLSVWRGTAQHDQIHLHRQYASSGTFYAPIVRLGPNLYSITRPEKVIYGIGSKTAKSAWYEGWKHPDPARFTLFADRNIARHAETRRKFQAMFSLSSLLHYEPFVDAAQDIFRHRLAEMAQPAGTGKSGVIDLHHWFQCYAFDVIGNISYGRRFGFLDAGEDIEHCMASLHSAMVYSTLVGIYPWAHPVLYRLLEKLPGSGAAGRTFIMRFVGKLVAERRTQRAAESAKAGTNPPTVPMTRDDVVGYDDLENAPKDFLDLMLDAEQDASRGVTAYHVFMMGLSNVIAGSDTTAVSLSSVLYHLLRHPACLAKLRRELDAATRAGAMTPARVSLKESQKQAYLQACIKEGLRLCTATGLPLWRTVPEGGVQIQGNFFPAGTEIGLNPWVLHYDRDVWGEDAAMFRPERWLEADAEQLKFMEAHYMPFGLGSRTCLGRHISYLEMCKVIPMIVSMFDLELEHPDRDWKTSNFWFVRPTDFLVTVKARPQPTV